MKFRLSRSEPLRTLKQNLPRYEALGMNVEIRLTDADFNRAVSVKDLEELERELRGRKISAFCHLPFHGLNLSCPDSRVMEYSREVIREGLEIGTILGCRVAILHSGFSSQIRPRQVEAWKERFIESMKELVTIAEDEEVVLAIENAYEPDANLLLEVLQAVDSPWLRFCIDLGHAACYSRMAPEEWVQTFREQIISLDFHDNEGLEDEHVACGRGVVGYDVVYEALKDIEGTANITLEVADADLDASLEHLASVGFSFEKGEMPESEIFPSTNGV